MATFRKKPIEVEAVQWQKDGDHPAVELVAPVIRFNRRGDYFYVSHVDRRLALPQAWLMASVDKIAAGKEKGLVLPFNMYELPPGLEVPATTHPDLLALYTELSGWPHEPGSAGVVRRPNSTADVVSPGDWIITTPLGPSVCTPEMFEAVYEPVDA